jgi:hypothetical protein
MLTAVRQIEASVSLIAENYKSGDRYLEACVVYCGNFVVDVILAIVHGIVVLIWTANQNSC